MPPPTIDLVPTRFWGRESIPSLLSPAPARSVAVLIRFDPASYPGSRPDGPVLISDDEVVPLHLDGPAAAPLRLAAAHGDAGRWPVLAPGAARFSLAYRSNAAPDRLHDKALTGAGAVLLPARVRGWVPAFEARRTGYGAVPLTLVPEPGAVTETWVLGVPTSVLPLLDLSEGREPDGAPAEPTSDRWDHRQAPPGTYQLGRIGDVEVAGGFRLPDALAYLPGPSTDVQVDEDGAWRTWQRVDQAAAGRHVDRAGPSGPLYVAGLGEPTVVRAVDPRTGTCQAW